MTAFEEAQVVAALEDNAKAHAEIDRLRLVVAALTEALELADARLLRPLLRAEMDKVHAALALARAEVKPVDLDSSHPSEHVAGSMKTVSVGAENLGDLTGTKFGEQLARHAFETRLLPGEKIDFSKKKRGAK